MSDLRKRFSLDYLVSTKTTSIKQNYKVVFWDIDGSEIKDDIQGYSFEDALIRARSKFPGYTIKSVEIK